jgi:ParB-like chromosome segregation protein Spo0J
MKLRPSLLALLATLTGSAQAMTIDAKALARFDRSYIVCEAKFPAMKGHRDEAYLSLWRVKPGAAARAELAAARKAASYRAEQARLQKGGANAASAAASSPIEQQCQALWAEALGTPKARP